MLIQTVCTLSYLPFAGVMLDSLQAHCPDTDCSILISDITRKTLNSIKQDYPKDHELLCCDDLEVESIPEMRSYYSILEFNSSCKVLALRYQLHKKNHTECLFLDPDMLVFGDITPLFQEPQQPIQITPHNTKPYPKDKLMPTDLEIALSGHINGGIVYFRSTPKSLEALDWLFEQTRFNWFVAPYKGMYADQQWLTLLPYYYGDETFVNQNLGLNLSYWNLHGRPLKFEDGRLTVDLENGVPVLIFHFSGFNIPCNGQLSQHTQRKFDDQTQEIISKLALDFESRILKKRHQMSKMLGHSTIPFCDEPLGRRMKRAKKRWNNEYLYDLQNLGLFEKIGRKIDRLLGL